MMIGMDTAAEAARGSFFTELATEVAEGKEIAASVALRELVRARTRLHRLQRDLVHGRGDDGRLDDAVVAYRHARAAAAHWLTPVIANSPSADELFAGWLIEATGGAADAARHI